MREQLKTEAAKWQSALALPRQERMMVSKTGGQIKIVICLARRRVCAYIGFRVITTRPFVSLHKRNVLRGTMLEVERKGGDMSTTFLSDRSEHFKHFEKVSTFHVT